MNWDEIEHFTREEFECHCGCGRADMDPDFVQKLDDVRDELGFPLRINSGFRCPEHNDAVSSTGRDGPHTTGKAADVGVRGKRARRLAEIAFQVFDGVGINQAGKWSNRFVHVDDLGYRIWSY